jgi:hypothetical protein
METPPETTTATADVDEPPPLWDSDDEAGPRQALWSRDKVGLAPGPHDEYEPPPVCDNDDMPPLSQ